MAVIASGEIDLKLSAKSQAALENQLAKASNTAGGKAGKDFSAAFAGQTKGLGGGISKALGSINTGTLVAGLGAAAGALATFAALSVKHFEDAAQAVRAFQRVTLQTGPDASRMLSAFDDMGISAGAATLAFSRLALATADNGKKLADFGINVARTKTGNTDLAATFDNVRKSIRETQDPAQRVQIAVAAFGKTGRDILPVLQLTDTEFAKLKKNANDVFTDKQLLSAEAYRRSLDNLHDSIGEVENTIGQALVPILTRAANALATVADKARPAIEPLAVGLVSAIPGVNILAGAIGFLGGKSKDASLSAKDLATASQILGVSQTALAGQTKDIVSALVDERKALDDVLAATLAGFDASVNYQQAKLAERDAIRDVQAKHEALTTAVRENGANSLEAAVAADDLSKAVLAQEEAARRSADAMGNLAKQNAITAGAADTTKPALDAQIASLQASVRQIAGTGGNVDALNALIKHLQQVRGDYVANIDAATGPAEAKIAHLKSSFAGLKATGFFNTVPNLSPAQGGPDLSARGPNGINDTVSVLPPGRSIVNNQTGKPETIVNADLIRSGAVGGTVNITVNEVAQDPRATAFAVSERLGAASQR